MLRPWRASRRAGRGMVSSSKGFVMNAALQTSKYKYMVLALLYLGWCISYIDRAAITFAATHIASEFQLKPSELGVLLSSFFLGYSLLQLPGGWLGDRFGSRPVIVISILLWSVCTGAAGGPGDRGRAGRRAGPLREARLLPGSDRARLLI